MQPVMQLWMPPILSMLTTLIVVVFTAWLNTKALSAQIEAVRSEIGSTKAELRSEMGGLRSEIEALRAEMKQGFAELRLEFHTEISALSRRVERLEETRQGGLFRP
jgi:hypothetical protein